MRKYRTSLHSLVAVTAVMTLTACQKSPEPIHVAYQTGVDPSKVAQADGSYEKQLQHPIEWTRFNSGAEVINAMASGDIDIGNIGSSPLAAAASRQLPIQVFIVSAQIEGAEALVVQNSKGINSPQDLKHKKIATPFVSTSHYSLLGALKHWSIDPKDVQLVNLNPSEINAAWKRGDIDAAFVWSPALAEIKKTGHILATAKEVSSWGQPTFEVWAVRNEFAKQHPEWVSQFAKVSLAAYQNYYQHKTEWNATSKPVAAISKLTGVNPQDVPGLLEGAHYPLIKEQLSPQLLGGGTAKAIADTSQFLKTQGLINSTLNDYSPFVSATYIKKLEP